MYGRVPAFEIGHDEDTPRSHRRAGYSPARVAARLQNIVQSQGLGLLLGIFGVFFVFVFVPVFVVDDLLYVRTVAPEYDRKSRKRPSAAAVLARHERSFESRHPLRSHNRSGLAAHLDALRNATGDRSGAYALRGYPDSRGTAPEAAPPPVDDDRKSVVADDEPPPHVDDGVAPPPEPVDGGVPRDAEEPSPAVDDGVQHDVEEFEDVARAADRAEQDAAEDEPQMTLDEPAAPADEPAAPADEPAAAAPPAERDPAADPQMTLDEPAPADEAAADEAPIAAPADEAEAQLDVDQTMTLDEPAAAPEDPAADEGDAVVVDVESAPSDAADPN